VSDANSEAPAIVGPLTELFTVGFCPSNLSDHDRASPVVAEPKRGLFLGVVADRGNGFVAAQFVSFRMGFETALRHRELRPGLVE